MSEGSDRARGAGQGWCLSRGLGAVQGPPAGPAHLGGGLHLGHLASRGLDIEAWTAGAPGPIQSGWLSSCEALPLTSEGSGGPGPAGRSLVGSLLLRGQMALSLSILAHCLDVPDLVGGWESEWGGAGGGAGSQVWARVWGQMVCEGWLAASRRGPPTHWCEPQKGAGGASSSTNVTCCHHINECPRLVCPAPAAHLPVPRVGIVASLLLS